jgi:L-amino acid N-acyltransferase YncA
MARPLEKTDTKSFHEFFCAMPGQELMFLKHRVTEPDTINDWCNHIDLGRNFPLLAITDEKIVGVATLHQQLGGWKRHIGRVSVQVHPQHRGRGLAQKLVSEIIEVARQCALEKIEAEFIDKQVNAIKMFALLGFSELVHLNNYVKDMQAVSHDYILMGLDLITDEEYASAG